MTFLISSAFIVDFFDVPFSIYSLFSYSYSEAIWAPVAAVAAVVRLLEIKIEKKITLKGEYKEHLGVERTEVFDRSDNSGVFWELRAVSKRK